MHDLVINFIQLSKMKLITKSQPIHIEDDYFASYIVNKLNTFDLLFVGWRE